MTSTYIPLIKTTGWIDLSPEHKQLRIDLQENLRTACIDKSGAQPIMLQGAFGIGKTNTLFYLFHYAWCELGVPAFFVSLEQICVEVREVALGYPNNKIPNAELGPLIKKILQDQLSALKKQDWSDLVGIYFPEFKENMAEYLDNFKAIKVTDLDRNETSISHTFSESVIRKAIKSETRPVLLIDEFESKFYELKKHIETSGGGVLRELFDQIVQDQSMFFLIIGNGPASGYEIARERGGEQHDSETAANRRLNTRSIPFPTPKLLERSFLLGDPKGYINFIWWLSRCRPGHILRLRNTLGEFSHLDEESTTDLISRPIFKEPIDDGGESVSYLKTDIFNDINGKIQAAMLGKMIRSFSPVKFDIENYRDDLKGCADFFFCANQLASAEEDILPAIKTDLYDHYLKSLIEEGQFSQVNFLQHIQPYLSHILNSISDENGQIAFGMINDIEPIGVFAKTFITPLLELTYDFITLYQDDTVLETRQALDFLLQVINKIGVDFANDRLDDFFSDTFELFERCKLKKYETCYLQLSLLSIRTAIEQPIGSPNLKYKNQNVASPLASIPSIGAMPILQFFRDNMRIYFIPKFEQDLQTRYLKSLKETLFNNFHDTFHDDAKLIIRVIYLEESEQIVAFKNDLLLFDGNKLEPIYLLKKIDVLQIDHFQLNFSGQLSDFIDSTAKISIIGAFEKEIIAEINDVGVPVLDIKKVIEKIGTRPWTDKKETIRTIEHYRKLLLEGSSSAFEGISLISKKEYENELSSRVCNKAIFLEAMEENNAISSFISTLSNTGDPLTLRIMILYLIEHNAVSQELIDLIDLTKSNFYFGPESAGSRIALKYDDIKAIIGSNDVKLSAHFSDFSLKSDIISRLISFSDFISREVDLASLEDFSTYLTDTLETHYFSTYGDQLAARAHDFNLIIALYDLAYLRHLDLNEIAESIKTEILELTGLYAKNKGKLVEDLEELRVILNEPKPIFTYADRLSKLNRGMVHLQKIMDEDLSYSSLIIVDNILGQLKASLAEAESFAEDISSLVSELSTAKSEVDELQEEIEILYHDRTLEKISADKNFNNEPDYLWNHVFLSHLKGKEDYVKFLGEEKINFKPFGKNALIPAERITKFSVALSAAEHSAMPILNGILEGINEKKEELDNYRKLAEYIAEMLNLEEKIEEQL